VFSPTLASRHPERTPLRLLRLDRKRRRVSRSTDANQQWAEMLADWAIPEELIAAAPESPYFFDPAVFTDAADEALRRTADTISDRVAREALPVDGRVLDIGVGAGAASLRLGAAHITGVDPSTVLLDAFAKRAERVGVTHTTVEASWPEAAPQTPRTDVAVCHHVVYNVADLAAFAQALTEHATRRVVVELTAAHPMTWLAPYWKALHGLDQPDRPVADDAIIVLEEQGLTVQRERWSRPIQMIGETGDEQLSRIARRLCLGPDRHDELRSALDATPPPAEREVVTLWWAPS
jgi:SAM-dependent methyltransferase